MQAYRVETTVAPDGSVVIRQLPVNPGDVVEVIVLVQERKKTPQQRYPLQGTPITYHNPTEPVAEDEWKALP
ncbi:MAG: hypothetical protein ACFCBW_11815 [Candidatus Competibacterales bacterium]